MKKLTHEEVQESKPSVEEVKKMDRTEIYLLLDNVRSLHNVGAIFRTADAVLVKKIMLCGITGTPPRKEISKTALGAEELVPWEYFDDAEDAVDALKADGVEIVAVEIAHDAELYSEAKFEGPVCFVLGHEVEGISDDLMEHVDRSIYLPMLGRANSLNVATCCGVILYDTLRKLNEKN